MTSDRRPTGVAARLHAATAGPSISFEMAPPRSDATRAALPDTLARLAAVAPDFFSVTYGASGSSRPVSREIVRWLLHNTDADVVAHLTCVGSPPEDVRVVVEGLLDDGVRNLLALRGDPPAGVPDWRPHPQGLRRGSELVELLRDIAADLDVPLSIGVAATPSAPWGPTADPEGGDDIKALLAKQVAGADYAITQVFYEVESYIRYRDAARAAGVTLPLLPGLVPLDNPRRLRKLQNISGVPVPESILARLDSAADADERRAAGREMGVDLVRQVLDAGAPGVHLYTFNQHASSLDLLEGAHLDGAGPSRTLAGRPQVTAPDTTNRDDHDRHHRSDSAIV